MKGNGALQMIFAFFLGLVVVGFVGIGVNTFYPEPSYVDYDENRFSQWRLVTGIILLVLATLILVISLTLPAEQVVISNGLLLGGVFTMVYAVGMTVFSDQSIWRFVVVAVALIVTIAIGYLKFVRRWAAPSGSPVAVAPTGAEPTGEVPADVAARLAHLEHRLDALRLALGD